MKYTFEMDYKVSLICTPILAVAGTVALCLGKNVSGCLPLWSWTVPVVVLDYLSFCILKNGSPGSAKKIVIEKKIHSGQVVITYFVTKFPIIVLFIMGLMVMADKSCREKWQSHNPLLLYFSVIHGAILLFFAFITVFFHECWDAYNVVEPEEPEDPISPEGRMFV